MRTWMSEKGDSLPRVKETILGLSLLLLYSYYASTLPSIMFLSFHQNRNSRLIIFSTVHLIYRRTLYFEMLGGCNYKICLDHFRLNTTINRTFLDIQLAHSAVWREGFDEWHPTRGLIGHRWITIFGYTVRGCTIRMRYIHVIAGYVHNM